MALYPISPVFTNFSLQEIRAEEEGEVRVVASEVHGEYPRAGAGNGEGKEGARRRTVI